MSGVITSAYGDKTVLSGTTYKIIRKLDQIDLKYEPLPNVQIDIYRKEGYVFEIPKASNFKGDFDIHVPSGEPFSVLFYTEGRVPELKQIAGIPKYRNKIAVVLEEVKEVIKDICSNPYQIEEIRNNIQFFMTKFQSRTTKNIVEDLEKTLKDIQGEANKCPKIPPKTSSTQVFPPTSIGAPTLRGRIVE